MSLKFRVVGSPASPRERPSFPVIEAVARGRLVKSQPLNGKVVLKTGLHARFSLGASTTTLLKAGARPEDTFVAVKPYDYPERADVLRGLRNKGVNVAPLSSLADLVDAAEARVRATGFKLLVVDDGGYGTCAVLRKPQLLEHTQGFVEQTTRGKPAVESACSELGASISKPLLYLPDSEIKREFECMPVGNAVVSALRRHVAAPLAGRKIAVIGAAGTIGKAVADTLIKEGAIVRAYDTNPKSAYWEIINLNRMRICMTADEAVADADVVIGATGKPILERQLRSLKDGVLLASASSGQYEFPLDLIERSATGSKSYRANKSLPIHGTTYRMAWGRDITVLDKGRPINLGIAAGPEHPCFDLIMALLVVGAAELASGRFDHRAGFVTEFDDLCTRHQLNTLYWLHHAKEVQ